MARTGRPKKVFDLVQLEKLAMMHFTEEEIAAWFGVDVRTIHRKKKNADFHAALVGGRLKGKVSIRRLQFEAAQRGNITMLIWLGKQYLGQQNIVSTEDPATHRAPIDFTHARQRLTDLLAKRAAHDSTV